MDSTQHPVAGIVASSALATVSWVDQIDILIRWGAGSAAIIMCALAIWNKVAPYFKK